MSLGNLGDLLVVGGHNILIAVSIVVGVIYHKALLTRDLEPPDLPQQLGGLAREHGAEDDFDHASNY